MKLVRKKVQNQVRLQVVDQVYNHVWWQSWSRVRDQVWNQWNQMNANIQVWKHN